MISVVAPFYNEVESLPELIAATTASLDSCEHRWEFVLVDDCSDDGGASLVNQAAAKDSRIRLIRLSERCGQSGALWTGIAASSGNILVTLDADLQNPPSEIRNLVRTLLETPTDLVAGIRSQRMDSAARRLASQAANRLRRWVLRDPFIDSGCSLRAYRVEYLEGLPRSSTMHRFLPIFAVWNGASVVQINVEHRPRIHGESKYRAISGRALTGFVDLFGMVWLRRRWVSAQTACRSAAAAAAQHPSDPDTSAQQP